MANINEYTTLSFVSVDVMFEVEEKGTGAFYSFAALTLYSGLGGGDVITIHWRKRLAILRNRLYLYPQPEPLLHTRLFWLALGVVTGAVLLFCGYFIVYLLAQHDAFLTNAEDLGIMDQSIWNTLHGNMLHMTICNILNDTNCVTPAGYTRFAIHFEPILFPVAAIYALWPSPKTLVIIQTIVVASGAYPAFWLARLRLRSELAGVAIALLYLLYPSLHQAVVYDFHALTLSAAFLLFALYFMYTRRTRLLFVCAILAMACKEEMPLVIVMFGLWSMFLQRRWRVGLALVVLAGAWFLIGFYFIIPHFSPRGEHLLIARYDGVKDLLQQHGIVQLLLHPGLFLQPFVFDPAHKAYIHVLLAPGGYIPLPGALPSLYLLLLAPWILVLALPSFAANLLSSKDGMYSGLFQYNAPIVPILIFAAIESLVVILWLARIIVQWLALRRARRSESIEKPSEKAPQRRWELQRLVHTGLLVSLLCFVVFSALRLDYLFHGQLPFSYGYVWPQETNHTKLAQKFIAMIPPTASLSAQTKLVPHVSQRRSIYLFPYGVEHAEAEYIFLDITGDVYPFYGSQDFTRQVKTVLRTGKYGVVAAQDGYLLLKRGLPAPRLLPNSDMTPSQQANPIYNDKLAFDLPASLCSYIDDVPKKLPKPMQVDFTAKDGGSISLLSSTLGAPLNFSHSGGYMGITTYWRVNQPVKTAQQVLVFLKDPEGRERFVSVEFPDIAWCQTTTWKPGTIIKLNSRVFGLQSIRFPNGVVHLSIGLIPLALPSDKMMSIQDRLSVDIVSSTNEVTLGNRAIEFWTLNIID